jgi:hypothetical protein
MIQSFFIYFLLMIASIVSAQNQALSSLNFVKKSAKIIPVDDGFKTIFAFKAPNNFDIDSPLVLELSLKDQMVEIKAASYDNSSGKVQGELPLRLFDSNIEGHLSFGKLLLSELDSVGLDSVVRLKAKLKAYPTVQGVLYLGFKQCCKASKKFWFEAEYYLLLSKQAPLQDSIKKEIADIQREKALKAASQKYLDVLQAQAEAGRQAIDLNFNQFKVQLNSLETINQNIDDGFEVTRSGAKLSDEQMKEIAFMTSDANKIKATIKESNKGEDALKEFDKVSKANAQYRNSKRQNDAICAQLLQSEKTLVAYKKLSTRTQVRIVALRKALRKGD